MRGMVDGVAVRSKALSDDIEKHNKLTGVDYYEKEDLETMKRLLEGQDWKKIDAALKNLKKKANML